jgi:hypothetical protein
VLLKVSYFQNEFMKSSFLPTTGLCSEGRNPDNFLFVFLEKRWLHKFILKLTDLYLWCMHKSRQEPVWTAHLLFVIGDFLDGMLENLSSNRVFSAKSNNTMELWSPVHSTEGERHVCCLGLLGGLVGARDPA